MLDVEYDSNEHHTGAVKLERDSRRRNAIRHVGYTVIDVTNSQLSSIESFEIIVDQVAQITGKRIRKDQRGQTPERLELMRLLFPGKYSYQ